MSCMMEKNMMNKKILLALAIIIIIAVIITLEESKPEQSFAERQEIARDTAQNTVDATNDTALVSADTSRILAKEEKYPKAVELVEPGFVNTEPFMLKDHIGKDIIMIDFWTYSCINCQRTLPYITAWHEKYANKGLLIVGIHTPEFAFEEKKENVQRAMQKFSVTYPVVQDNERKTWFAYQNRYWPHKYLIDIDGFIVYDHIGEGNYEETEKKIQELLEERNTVLGLDMVVDTTISAPDIITPEYEKIKTPELYFGYGFSRGQLANGVWSPEKTVTYTSPINIVEWNKFYLHGDWKNNVDNMDLVGVDGRVFLRYIAKNVNIVAGADSPVNVRVFLDGKNTRNITVQAHELYSVVEDDKYRERLLELQVEQGTKLYTFTFG